MKMVFFGGGNGAVRDASTPSTGGCFGAGMGGWGGTAGNH